GSVLKPTNITLRTGELVDIPQAFTLDPKLHYILTMEQLGGKAQYHTWASVEAALVNAETGETVFELADDYWAERGTWYEDGESGTWKEDNSGTNFNFRVAEAGQYQLQLSNSENDRRPRIVTRVQISSRKPRALNWM